MTPEQFSNKLREQVSEIQKRNTPLFLGATTGVSDMVERIFVRGADSFNRPIGTYSTKPTYINPVESPVSFAPRGKEGNTRFNNGKQHKTKYFERGYKQFRRQIGRQSSFTNLRLTNDLQSDVSNNVVSKSSGTVAQNPRPRMVNVNEYVIDLRDANLKKVKGLERKYGTKIFRHTKQEKKRILDTIEFELFKILNA